MMHQLPLHIIEEIKTLNKAGLSFNSIINYMRLKYPLELNSSQDIDLEIIIKLIVSGRKTSPIPFAIPWFINFGIIFQTTFLHDNAS